MGLSGTLCRSRNQKTPTRSNLKSSTRRWFSISSQTKNYYRIIQHITSSILTSSTSQNYNVFLVIHKIFIFMIHIWNFYHKRHFLCQVKINQWPGMAQLGRKDNLFTASSFSIFHFLLLNTFFNPLRKDNLFTVISVFISTLFFFSWTLWFVLFLEIMLTGKNGFWRCFS